MWAAAPPRFTPVTLVLVILLVAGCAPRFQATRVDPLTPEELSSLWEAADPQSRNLFYGVGGAELQPDPDAVYEVLERDTGGFSTTFDVRDPRGREWGVKIGDEAQSEVTASRIVWAAGYRQPPTYYLPRWRAREDGREVIMEAGRFRPKLEGLKSEGAWAWRRNPFVGSQPFRGLIVLMMILNSTDLKDDNNGVYELTEKGRPVGRWYVVKDLGATLGTTGRIRPKRSDVDEFEKHPYIEGVRDGRVLFHFRGRHGWMLRDVTAADVEWISERLARLTDEQWRGAFEAGGYSDDETRRYMEAVAGKIAQGRALRAGNAEAN